MNTDPLDTIATAFSERRYLIVVNYKFKRLVIAIESYEAQDATQAKQIAERRAHGQRDYRWGSLVSVETLADTEDNRVKSGITCADYPPSVFEHDNDWYDGLSSDTRIATHCRPCGERLEKYEQARGRDVCAMCRADAHAAGKDDRYLNFVAKAA